MFVDLGFENFVRKEDVYKVLSYDRGAKEYYQNSDDILNLGGRSIKSIVFTLTPGEEEDGYVFFSPLEAKEILKRMGEVVAADSTVEEAKD